MSLKDKTKHFITRLKDDFIFRTYVTSVASLFVTAAFIGYNLYLWSAYGSNWNISIAIYFLLLIAIRSFVMLAERKVRLSSKSSEQKEKTQANLYLAQSILLFLIDLALIMPISLMVLQHKEINYTAIPAITTATYTVYKITMSSIGFKKTRKMQNLSLRMLKNVNFIDSLVSVLTLQYTLIMTFGDGIVNEMFVLCCVSSFVIWTLLIVLSVISVVLSAKLRKQLLLATNETVDQSAEV